jgi:hypothetical protein
MSYYSEPEMLIKKASEAFNENKIQQSLILYTEAISMFIDTYKHDRDYARKAHYTNVIGVHLTTAERIKTIARLPSVPNKILSPIIEKEEEMETIKIGEGPYNNGQ